MFSFSKNLGIVKLSAVILASSSVVHPFLVPRLKSLTWVFHLTSLGKPCSLFYLSGSFARHDTSISY